MREYEPMPVGGPVPGRSVVAVALIVSALAACNSGPAQPPLAEDKPHEETEADARFRGNSHGSEREAFSPRSVAFWDEQRGLIAGQLVNEECEAANTCESILQRTNDGGKTWRIVERGSSLFLSLATFGRERAWVTVGHCAKRDECIAGLLTSRDGGKTWERVSGQRVIEPSFGSHNYGWAVKVETHGLSVTADGGRSWQGRRSPCPEFTPYTVAVSAAMPARAWVFCRSEGATAMMGKSVMETADAGQTWQLVAATPLGFSRDPFPRDGIFSTGHATGIFFRPEGVGWMWGGRGLFLISHDGGRTWSKGGRGAVEFGVSSMDDAWFVSSDVGYALVWNHGLMKTSDGGLTWTEVRKGRGGTIII